ncbi:MAG: alpha-amylase family glycosyl hydrolase [Chloroflexota bacterium]
MRRHQRFRWLAMPLIALLLAVAALPGGSPALASHTGQPTSVTVAGSLQSELGCPGDWQPECAITQLVYDADDTVWQGVFSVPAGSWEYKAALNGSWDENYGANATPGGANISLDMPAAGSVKFYYSHDTHWIADNRTKTIAVAPGSYQSEIGCPGDWDPGCLRSWLQDPDGDGIYVLETSAIPAGNYEFKIAINESWDENYGAGGVPDGPNIPFTVPADGLKVRFTFNPATKAISVGTGHGNDNNVEYFGLGHNSQSDLYRVPFGAVNPGTPVTLRFRTYANDVTSVRVRLYDTSVNQETFLPMERVARGVSCYDPAQPDESCDYWQTTITPARMGTLYYRFIVTDGSATAYYADDQFKDGGWGEATPSMIDNSYVITVFDPLFKPIPWMRDAVIYQIFPDRFRNGRSNNDPRGTEPRYGYPSQALDRILVKQWGDLPEGYCRKYVSPAQPCGEEPRGRDYFGGDLRGVDQRLNYLQALGVTAIYFNPIFDAASNHAYDTQDYYKIDPFFGTEQDWENLVKHANQRGIRIILDGVFNHVSSDSPYFDRYGHFPGKLGACESMTSPYRDWFTFRPQAGGPCVGPDGPNTMTYDAWFGFDSLPVLNKNNPEVRALFYADNNSVARHWLRNGAAGWRLDVMGDPSFPDSFWQEFRDAVRATKADAPVIGELWKKEEVLPKIHGDMADTVMNYRFRNAILGFFGTVDDKGFVDDGQSDQPPSLFARKLQSIREDYPDATYFTLMNILDSHDTQRILWSLTPGAHNREAREFNAANLAIGKARLRLAALVQMTVPGAPTIYYGDEIALNGDDDPDDRRTFPWDGGGAYGNGGDQAMLAWYTKLTGLRKANSVLRTGSLDFLLTDDANRTLAYARRDGASVAIVAINRAENGQRTLEIPLSGYLRDGVTFTDALGSGSYTSAGGKLTITLPALGGALLIATPGQDLTGPAAPAGLSATPGNGVVDLSWSPVAGAASYNIYRSPVSGGGFELVGTASGTTYSDTGVANGTRYHYVVRALDGLGNEGERSNEAAATPSFPIGYAVLQHPKTISYERNVNPTETIYGQVYAAGLTDAGGDPEGILAQVGYGPQGSDPAGWTTWKAMSFNVRVGNNYEYMGNLRPETAGTYDLLVRFSTDGGLTWSYGDQDGAFPGEPGTDLPGVLTVTLGPDTTPPAAPTNLRVDDWSAGFIRIAWDEVADAAEYRVFRATTSGGFDFDDPLAILPAGSTTYTDNEVGTGTTYYYVVKAYDAALNGSPASNEISQTAEPKLVAVTFRVRVPDETPPGDTVYIPGDIDLLGPWNPGKQPMVNMGGGIWEVTLNIPDGTQLQYKYTRGTWEQVEWWGTIVSTNNRSVSISYGTDGTQLVDDTATDWGNGPDIHKAVQRWRDPLVTSASGGASGVTVTFAADIQPATSGGDYAGAVVVRQGATVVPGTVTETSAGVLTWTPAAPLGSGTYSVTVSGVRSNLDGDSVPMQAPYTFTFVVP